MNKPELLSPAGDMEKLKIALLYGADAVYASTPNFSMRTREVGFDNESLKEGIDYVHKMGKKIYLTINTFPHPFEIDDIKEHIKKTIDLKPDAIIAADPGIVSYIASISDIPIHLSTQASTTNQLSAEFWRKQGASRIVLARELSLKEIKKIKDESSVEIETFVHGAMCMAYSGRCQISNYMTGRDPNKGECVQACRFKYKLYDLKEDFREEPYQIYEDDHGSYILNSRDLCMIDQIPGLIDAGVISFKIEGRLKSIYYVGAVTRAYRKAIDLYFDDAKAYEKEKESFLAEIRKTSNRGFTTGFYLNKPDPTTNNYETSRAKEEYRFVGIVVSYDKKVKMAEIEAKNHIEIGDHLEIVTPDKIIQHKLNKMIINGSEAQVANANSKVFLPIDEELPEKSFLRVKVVS